MVSYIGLREVDRMIRSIRCRDMTIWNVLA